jgi:hypothetical protein
MATKSRRSRHLQAFDHLCQLDDEGRRSNLSVRLLFVATCRAAHKEVYGHLGGRVGDIDHGDMITEAALHIDSDGWWDALILLTPQHDHFIAVAY